MKRTILVLAMLCFPELANGTVVFEDGGIHYVDYEINDDVLVREGGSHITTLNLISGGRIADFLRVRDVSVVNISGGILDGVLYADSQSKVNVLDGVLNSRLYIHSPYVNVSGGIISDILECYGTGGAVISAGELRMGTYFWNYSNANIMGGEILLLRAYDNSQVTITGGQFTDTWDQIVVTHNAIITIFGTDFNYDYGEIPDNSGTLIGTLENGQPINAEFRIVHYGGGYDGATIVLVPEPSTLLLIGLGAVLLRKIR